MCGLSILFFFLLNRSNVKKVHGRLYYLENGGRSVCGTAAIGGQQRPASPEKKAGSLPLQTLTSLPLNMLYTLATSGDHDFPLKARNSGRPEALDRVTANHRNAG